MVLRGDGFYVPLLCRTAVVLSWKVCETIDGSQNLPRLIEPIAGKVGREPGARRPLVMTERGLDRTWFCSSGVEARMLHLLEPRVARGDSLGDPLCLDVRTSLPAPTLAGDLATQWTSMGFLLQGLRRQDALRALQGALHSTLACRRAEARLRTYERLPRPPPSCQPAQGGPKQNRIKTARRWRYVRTRGVEPQTFFCLPKYVLPTARPGGRGEGALVWHSGGSRVAAEC